MALAEKTMAVTKSSTHDGSASHDECDNPVNHERRASNVLIDTKIEYDNIGPTGIFRSPYVFGAALLASFGGFSFGYGKIVIIKPAAPYPDREPDHTLQTKVSSHSSS
jgi:hypothetical protein